MGHGHCSPQSGFNSRASHKGFAEIILEHTSHKGFTEIILEHREASLTPAVTTGDLCDQLKSAPHQHEFMVGPSLSMAMGGSPGLAPSLGHGPVWGGAAQDPLHATNPCPCQWGWNKRIFEVPSAPNHSMAPYYPAWKGFRLSTVFFLFEWVGN